MREVVGHVPEFHGPIVHKMVRTIDVARREVAQNETQPLNIIRTRQPYVDVEPVSASPLKPGDSADFRLVFDTVAQDWDGAFPEIRVVHVDSR